MTQFQIQALKSQLEWIVLFPAQCFGCTLWCWGSWGSQCSTQCTSHISSRLSR